MNRDGPQRVSRWLITFLFYNFPAFEMSMPYFYNYEKYKVLNFCI